MEAIPFENTILAFEDRATEVLMELDITPDQWMEMSIGEQFYRLFSSGYMEELFETDEYLEVDTEGLWESPE